MDASTLICLFAQSNDSISANVFSTNKITYIVKLVVEKVTCPVSGLYFPFGTGVICPLPSNDQITICSGFSSSFTVGV
ncbi:hypothetical protein D3C85_1668860 [compost metagenome]